MLSEMCGNEWAVAGGQRLREALDTENARMKSWCYRSMLMNHEEHEEHQASQGIGYSGLEWPGPMVCLFHEPTCSFQRVLADQHFCHDSCSIFFEFFVFYVV
ncbi:MAG: hypothetical protein IT425_01500 [Pirellulales bacterium]|nr:hypothetical protein [Pirellulales bacterium]